MFTIYNMFCVQHLDEDDVDIKSNTELCDMYSSPVKKKKKAEDIDDDLQRFMYATKEDAAEGIVALNGIQLFMKSVRK